MPRTNLADTRYILVAGDKTWLYLNCYAHIDQLTKTMRVTGTPGPELLSKITSDEVGIHGYKDW